jgi:hypothetical protein
MSGFSNGHYFPLKEATERILLIVNLTSNFVAGRKGFNGRRVLTILLVLAGAAIGAPSVFAA